MSEAYRRASAEVLARPADPEASFRFAGIASRDGDPQAAIAALERVLLLNPQLDNIRLELGVLYLQTGASRLGTEMIRTALDAPDMPPEVRVRAEEYLRAGEAEARPFRDSGALSLGVERESNANSGPDALLPVGGSTLTPESLGQADTSVLLQAGIALRTDLGVQAGHALALDLAYASRRYARQDQLDLERLAASPGVDLGLEELLGRPAMLELRLDGVTYRRGGAHYLDEFGASATLRLAGSESTEWEAGAFYLDQDFIPTPDAAANDLRDGRYLGLALRHDRALSDTASAYLGLAWGDKAAEASYEAFRDLGLSAGYAQAFAAPFRPEAGPWIALLDARLVRRDYAGTDTELGLSSPRGDTIWSLTAGLDVPVVERTAVRLELGYFRQNSNSPVHDYDNLSGAIRVTHRF